MKLKLDAEGHAVLQEGKPVYLHDDGKEVPFDAPATVATISRLNGEAKSHRERAETAETKLKTFEGIEDPKVAKQAIETLKNLDHKKLVDAGEVEKVKSEAIKALEEQYAPVVKERDQLKSDLYAEKIGGSFARSKFITDKIAIPFDLVQARFGQSFEVKDNRIVAKDAAGNPIYSRVKAGELADFEEALEQLVDQYPQRDSILKGTGHKGDGANQHNGANGGGPKSMKRAEFDKLDPVAQMKSMQEKVAVVD